MLLHDGPGPASSPIRHRSTITISAVAVACLFLYLYLLHHTGPGSSIYTARSSYQINRPGEDLAGFLDRTVGDNRDNLVWLTLADAFYSQTSTRHLHRSMEENLKPYTVPGVIYNSYRKHRLVILCLDEGCMESCKEREWTCYDGFRFNKPEIMLEATWPKLAGIIQTLESGRDLMFVDSDVFLKGDPFLYMHSLGSYDLQIQDEGLRNTVNTGFMHISSNALTIAHFQGVLDLDLHEVSRDQANTNRLLGFRESLNTSIFHSLNGLEVAVIRPEIVYAYHLELAPERKEVASMDAVAFHGTCLDNAAYKYLIARDFGFWQDIDGFYSEPPRLLVLPSLSGTEAQIFEQFSQFVALGAATERSLVPPATVTIKLVDNTLVLRQFASVFDLYLLNIVQKLPVLEPKYITHALQYHLDSSSRSSSRSTFLDSASIAAELLDNNEFNMIAYRSLQELQNRLSEADFEDKLVVTLTNWEAGMLESDSGKNISEVQGIEMCKKLNEPVMCGQLCRK